MSEKITIDALESITTLGSNDLLLGYDVGAAGTKTKNVSLSTLTAALPFSDYPLTSTLGTAAFTNSTAYATAAQGSLAQSAIQDSGLEAAIDAHTALADPHNQYALKAGVTDAIAAHVGESDPHSQYIDLAALNVALDNYTLSSELGTAALFESGDFASATQGQTADTALQPGAIGVTVQGYSTRLAEVSALTGVDGQVVKLVGGSLALASDLTSDGGTGGVTEFTGLTDTPAAIVDGQFLKGGPTSLQFVALAESDIPQLDVSKVTGASTAADITSAIATHSGEANPHPDYVTTAELADSLEFYALEANLGTAALTDSTDYATAAQGNTADNALQPGDIGVTIQGELSAAASAVGLNGQALENYANSVRVEAGVSYSITAADIGREIQFTAATAVTVNFPDLAEIGFHVVLTQLGAGSVSWNASGTYSFLNLDSHIETAGAGASVSIRRCGLADTYLVQGATA